MTKLARRSLLAGTIASAAAMFSRRDESASAQDAPPARQQAPGFYRYNVGTIEIIVVTDGAIVQPLPDDYVRNASRSQVSEELARLHMDRSTILAPLTPVVVRTGRQLVLIDTGLGPQAYQQSKGAVGQLHTNLAVAGIDRAAVNTVVLSHLHRDHVNGLLTADNKPAFPNAEIMVPATEWKFWSDDGNLSRMPAGSIPEINFKNARRVFGALGHKVTQYEPGKDIVPGITAIATPGHTPGHVSHLVTSGTARLLVQGDLTAFTALLFVHNPGWHVFFDMDGAVAEESRRRTYDMVIADDIPIQGYHLPFPAVGHLDKVGPTYAFAPAAWRPSL